MQEQQLPIVQVDFDEARELADLLTIRADLEFVAEAADRLAGLLDKEPLDGVIAKALQSAALIAYVRCFTSGKRFGLTEQTLDRGPEGAREYHRYLKDMRDKHIAHSVSPFERMAVGAVLSVDEDAVEGVAQFHMQHITFDKEGAIQLARYARQLSTVLNADGKKLTEDVQRKASETIAELRQRPRGLGFHAADPDQARRSR